MRTVRFRAEAAFSLIEVALALGVAGFCLVALLGMLPVAVNANQAASEQSVANSVATAVISDLRAAPRGTSVTSQLYKIPLPDSSATSASATVFLDAARQVVTDKNLSRYRVVVSFTPLSGGKTATCANLLVSWPGPVDPAARNPAGSVSLFFALDRN